MDPPHWACQLFQQRRAIVEPSTGTALLKAFLLCLCFIFLGGEGRVLRVSVREGVLRGIIESTEGASSLHLMIWRWRQAPSGAPCQSFWARSVQTSIKTHKKNSPTRAPGWIADANVKDSVFFESFSTRPWALSAQRDNNRKPPSVLLIVKKKQKLQKKKNPECRITFFFLSHVQFHTSITLCHSSIFLFPSHLSLLFSFLLSLYSCHDKCQTQSFRRLFFLSGNQELAKSNVRWDKTAAEASHWSISIRYFCESNRNVWRCCHKLTGSCCLCAPEGNGAFSPLLSPPSLLLFLNLFLCLVVITFIVVKNLSMAVFFVGFDRGGRRVVVRVKIRGVAFLCDLETCHLLEAAGSLSVTAMVCFNHLCPTWRGADG